MAKTIKDLANEQALSYNDPREAYYRGAYLVLEIVEGYIAELPCKSTGENVNQQMLLHRIKQLKGE